MIIYHVFGTKYKVCYYVMMYRVCEQVVVTLICFITLPWCIFYLNFNDMSLGTKIFLAIWNIQNCLVEVYVICIIYRIAMKKKRQWMLEESLKNPRMKELHQIFTFYDQGIVFLSSLPHGSA